MAKIGQGCVRPSGCFFHINLQLLKTLEPMVGRLRAEFYMETKKMQDQST